MLGFLSALIPGTAANTRPSRSGLFGFPPTPNYDRRQTAARASAGIGGMFGFPATPTYLDASLPKPEPEPEPCEGPSDENGNTGDNDRTRSDRTR